MNHGLCGGGQGQSANCGKSRHSLHAVPVRYRPFKHPSARRLERRKRELDNRGGVSSAGNVSWIIGEAFPAQET